MIRNDRLSLPEEILLLALQDEAGTIEMGSMYQYAIGGAVLAELLLRDRIRIDASRKSKLIDLVSAKPVGEPLLDGCLQRIRDVRKRGSVQTWVTRFANTKNLKHRLATRLCDRGILHASEDKVLLLFSRRIYPELDPAPERELIARLRRAIFGDSDRLDARTVVLVSLADSAGLLKMAFDKKDLKSRKQRLTRITSGDAIGQATKKAIEAVQAALFVACIVPTLITTTTITH